MSDRLLLPNGLLHQTGAVAIARTRSRLGLPGAAFFIEQPPRAGDTSHTVSSVLQVRPWAQRATTPASPEAEAEAAREQLRLVEGLQANHAWARAAFVDRHSEHVRRVLVRVLGAQDPDIEDLAQETFLAALEGVHKLSNPEAFSGWLTSIAVFSARGAIRKRQRWRWLRPVDNIDEAVAPGATAEERDAAACVYRILADMPADERIPFALRMFDGYELHELAQICEMSLATLRRRLASAQKRFDRRAREAEALAPWIQQTTATDACAVDESTQGPQP